MMFNEKMANNICMSKALSHLDLGGNMWLLGSGIEIRKVLKYNFSLSIFNIGKNRMNDEELREICQVYDAKNAPQIQLGVVWENLADIRLDKRLRTLRDKHFMTY
jgi:hypothetical protein